MSLNTLERPTGSGQQVFQGTNWQVKGSNRRAIAQLDQLWGSTLTFQPSVGVSWAHGLRHGVAMHPRGRHLREGMILPFTWESHHRPVNSNHHNNNQHNNDNITTTTGLRARNRSCQGICITIASKWHIGKGSCCKTAVQNLANCVNLVSTISILKEQTTVDRTRRA